MRLWHPFPHDFGVKRFLSAAVPPPTFLCRLRFSWSVWGRQNEPKEFTVGSCAALPIRGAQLLSPRDERTAITTFAPPQNMGAHGIPLLHATYESAAIFASIFPIVFVVPLENGESKRALYTTGQASVVPQGQRRGVGFRPVSERVQRGDLGEQSRTIVVGGVLFCIRCFVMLLSFTVGFDQQVRRTRDFLRISPVRERWVR